MVRNVTGKDKSRKGVWGTLEVMMALLNWVVSESLPEKGTFDQRIESREVVTIWDLEEYSRQRKTKCRDPKVGGFLVTLFKESGHGQTLFGSILNVMESGTQKANYYSGFNILGEAQKRHHSQHLNDGEAVWNCYFLLLGLPLYGYTTVCFSIYLLMDICSLGLLVRKLL